jgi:hypothetical protein
MQLLALLAPWFLLVAQPHRVAPSAAPPQALRHAPPISLAAKSKRGGKRAAVKPTPKTGGFGRPPTSSSSGGAAPEWAAFRDWIESNGGVTDAMELADCGGGLRGLRTTRAVASGKPLLCVPRRLLLDEAAAEASPVSGLWREDEPSLSTLGKLALALLHEARRPDALLAPYIATLPSLDEFATCGPAALWEPEEVALTENVQLRADAAQRRDGIAASPLLSDETRRGDAWQRLILPSPSPTNREVLWAIACVTSRALGVAGMVPVADLANHNAPHNIERGLTPDRSAFLFVAKTALRKGEQVWNSYGALPNLVLLSQFGFTLPSNPVEMTLARCTELVPTAHPFLLRSHAGGAIAEWQPAGPQLQAALLQLAQDGALPSELTRLSDRGELPVGHATSPAALADAAYAELLRRSLASFSTALEEDRRALAAADLPPRAAAAVAFRVEQKEKLHAELDRLDS